VGAKFFHVSLRVLATHDFFRLLRHNRSPKLFGAGLVARKIKLATREAAPTMGANNDLAARFVPKAEVQFQ
jgi:hypothetical protein